MPGRISRLLDYLQQHGAAYTLRRLGEKLGEQYLGTYDRLWERMRTGEAELQAQRAHQPPAGRISIIIPVYQTRPELLEELGMSILAQTYENWEACLYDGCSTSPGTREALEALAARDARFRVTLGTENEGISGNSNRALEMATGDYVVLCDHDDLLTPDALWRVAEAVVRTGAEMLYSDEDKVTENGHHFTDPHLKPDFCPELLRSGNYICHLLALRRQLVMRAGGFCSAYDGSQDHDLALRCSELANRVEHIPYILYHWRTVGSSASHQALERCRKAACGAVEAQGERMGIPCRARLVGDTMRLQWGIRSGTTIRALITARSDRDGEACSALVRKQWPGIVCEIVRTDGVGYARAVNRAAQAATEDVLLLIDSRVCPRSEGMVAELLQYAQRDDVGAVTPALVDVRMRIVHAGWALMDDGWARCRNRGLRLTAGGWHLLSMMTHNVAAVSTACCMVRRDHFMPMNEQLPPTEAGIAWCLSMSGQGLRHVYTPWAPAMVEDRHPLTRDVHLGTICPDPCMSPWHTRGRRADFRLRKGAIPHAADPIPSGADAP